jgi:dCTP deaminase
MAILCDTQIRELIGIEPFEENNKRPGRVSFGVSSYGYDIRVGSVFKIFTNVNSEVIDPKNFSEKSFVTIDTEDTGKDHVLIPPNSFALCETGRVRLHPPRLPRDLRGQIHLRPLRHHRQRHPDRARVAGKITLEISNTTPLPAKIYANEGIAQLIFLKGERVCAVSYADKRGKYQDQPGLTLPRVD